jgi:hypothetical protein
MARYQKDARTVEKTTKIAGGSQASARQGSRYTIGDVGIHGERFE